MSDYLGRSRMSFETAVQVVRILDGDKTHIVRNDDGTYSIVSHFPLEHCEYCDHESASR